MSIDEVELRSSISRQIKFSEAAKELKLAPEVLEIVKSGLQGS